MLSFLKIDITINKEDYERDIFISIIFVILNHFYITNKSSNNLYKIF